MDGRRRVTISEVGGVGDLEVKVVAWSSWHEKESTPTPVGDA
jgi:hypothetical protein